MSVRNFVPELWSAQLLVAFRKNLVFQSLVNRNYEGEIRQAGDTVRITTPSAITVDDYAGTVTYQAPTSTSQALLIDQHKYWGFKLRDVDQAQANVSLMQAYMSEAAYSLADTVDQNISALYTEAQHSIDITLSSGDMYATMVEAGEDLDLANVSRGNRWVVMSPKGYSKLLKTDEFIHATAAGDSVVRTGEVGSIAGFRVYTSNNLVLATTRKYLFGTNDAITFAEQLVSTEAMRLETAFDDAVRGQLLFGRKVVRPAALGVINATE
jgi:N4-gp56 family major capsid protein